MECIKNRKTHVAWIAALVLSLTMIMLGLGLTNAYALTGVEDNKVYNVTQSMTAYNSIQAAIDEADPGDTLVVGPGTYNESVVVDVENLTLKSNEGAETATITGGSSAVLVTVDHFTLEGFTVSASEWAIMVQAIAAGDVNISDCIINNAMYAVVFDTIADSTVTLSGNEMPTTWRGTVFEKAITGSTITVNDNIYTDIEAESVYFGKTITDSTVAVTGNSIVDCYNGIEIYGDIIDSEMNITENDVTGGYYGVYISDEFYGIYGTSVVTIEKNTFESVSNDGVYIYYLEKGAAANINNNTISNCDTGIYVDYLSYDYPDEPASLYIGENEISDCDYGIDLEYVSYGSAIIEANNLHNTCYGVYVDYSAYDYEETDVQVIDNCITADADNNGLYYGIYVYSAEAVLTISGNEVSGYSNSDKYDEGIYLEYIGYYGADPAKINVSDNVLRFTESAIYMYEVADDVDAEVLVSGNEIADSDYGLYIDSISSYAAEVDVIGNTLRNCGYGIYVYSIYGATDDEAYLTISWNVISGNDVGIYLNYVTLEQEEPGVWIVSNDITSNGTGLAFGHTPYGDTDLIVVSFNNFSGNTEYAINMLGGTDYSKAPAQAPSKAPSPESFPLQAQMNWWGDATGPKLGDNGATGDAINGLVNFDPWIQKLVITPKSSTGFEGKTRSFTATLYDSNGDIANAPLVILFNVQGANKAQGAVDLVNGIATFTYTGNNPGTDTVNAGLVFVEDPVLGLSQTADAIWTAVADNPGTDPAEENPGTDSAAEEGNPDTGDQSNSWYLYTLLISLLLGLGVVRFQYTATMKK